MKTKEKGILKGVCFFLKTGIWRVQRSEVGTPLWYGVKILRIVLLTLRGFVENRCQMRASSLTFYSLLSVVPVVAMLFGIAKGFGFQKTLEREIGNAFSAQSEVAAQIITIPTVFWTTPGEAWWPVSVLPS